MGHSGIEKVCLARRLLRRAALPDAVVPPMAKNEIASVDSTEMLHKGGLHKVHEVAKLLCGGRRWR